MGRYTKTTAPNKHIVLNRIYIYLNKRIHNADVIALMGEYPIACIKRIMKYIVRKNKTLTLMEIDRASIANVIKQGTLKKIETTFHKTKGKGVELHIINNDVTYIPVQQVEDLDFCVGFVTKRNNVKKQWATGTENAELSKEDPANIIGYRLHYQRQHLSGTRAMLGTVCLRTGFGKKFSFRCLDYIVDHLGFRIKTIDGVYDGYGRGQRVSVKGAVSSDGSLHHAYEHVVELMQERKFDEHPVERCVMKLYTYKDTSPMLTFMIMYT